jgi:hypothetical protein
MNRHALRRTSPKGGPFIGICMNCGRENLLLSNGEECPNPANFTQNETLLRAIRDDA